MPESDNPCSLGTGAESEVAADRVEDDAPRRYPMPARDKPFGCRTAGETGPRSASGSAPAPEGRILDMLSSTVLAIAGTGYGLIGLLVIIVLVLLIIRLV
jgi:hypothetical protein